MLCVKVIFADPQYNYCTDINGPMESVRKYFIGAPLNLGSGCKDNVQSPTGVELLGRSVCIKDLQAGDLVKQGFGFCPVVKNEPVHSGREWHNITVRYADGSENTRRESVHNRILVYVPATGVEEVT